MTTQELISRSRSHTEIVTADYSEELSRELELECDDSTDANGVTEYWGSDWRVHLTR